MSVKIHNGNELLIPLYHGTSELFIDSIRDHGLGARNPLKDWRVLPFFRDVLTVADRHLSQNDEWQAEQWYLKEMAEQKASRLTSWRHGSTFLSPSQLTAVRYAVSNPFGSELLSHAIKYFAKISTTPEGQELRRRHGFLAGLAGSAYRPILVELSTTPVDSLEGEQGQAASAVIENLVSTATGRGPELCSVMWQQFNFRATKPLSKRAHRLYVIDVESNDGWSLKYKLITSRSGTTSSGAQ